MTLQTEQAFLNELDKKLWTPGSEAGAGSADRLRRYCDLPKEWASMRESAAKTRRSGSLDAAMYKHAAVGLI